MCVPQDLHKGLNHPYKHSLCDGSIEVSFHYAIGPKSILGPKTLVETQDLPECTTLLCLSQPGGNAVVVAEDYSEVLG